MTDQHPMNPPVHMYAKWIDQAKALHPGESWGYISGEIAKLAYQAGADAELDACCEWLMYEHDRKALRADRRPILTSTSPTDEELCELYTKAYYKSADRQGPAAQAAALRAVLERWGK
jgi:hypothetical protein